MVTTTGSGSTQTAGCCPRKLNNGTIYTFFDVLEDPSAIRDEYGCHTGKNILPDSMHFPFAATNHKQQGSEKKRFIF